MVHSFDVETWKDRAHKRHSRFSSKKNADKALQRDILSINQLQVILKWCDYARLPVSFVKASDGEYDPKEKVIRINFKSSAESQTYMLLHEIGHHLINITGRSKDRISKGYLQDSETDRSMHYKVDLLSEEIEAWQLGLKLARELQLNLDDVRYNKYRVASVKTYIMWAAEK